MGIQLEKEMTEDEKTKELLLKQAQEKQINLLQDNSYKYLQKGIFDFDWNSTWSIGLLMRHLNVCRTIENFHLQTQKKEISILDVGCSLGLLQDFISNYKFFGHTDYLKVNYLGIDQNSDYVTEAQKHNRNVVNSDILQLATAVNRDYNCLPNSIKRNLTPNYSHPNVEQFDIIILAEVLEHIDSELKDFVQILYDLLKYRGKLFVTTPNPRKEIGELLVWPDDHKIEYTKDEVLSIFHGHYDYTYCFDLEDSYPWWTKKIVNDAKIGENEQYRKLSKFLPIPLAQYITSLLLEKDGSMMCYLFEKSYGRYS